MTVSALWSRRWLTISFALGLLLALLPLLQSRVLPFHDSPGIVGLGGALALRDDPGARVHEFYDIDIRPYPSALYFGWAWLAGAVGMPMDIAMSLFLGLFALAGPPLALLLLLDAFRRPRHLALLAFPISYHQQIWFGFLGSSAAVTGLLLALAFARRLHDHRPVPVAVGNHLGLAASLLFVAAAHPFPLALTLGVVAPLLLWPPMDDTRAPGWRPWVARARVYLLRLGTLLPAMMFLSVWFSGFFGKRTGGRSLLSRIWIEMGLAPPKLADAPRFVEWLGDGYRGPWDAVVPLLALATLVALLIRGARRPSGDVTPVPAHDWRRWLDWAGLGWAAAVLGLGYLLLPMQLMWPEPWWGARVRCVVPLYLVAVALVRPRARGLPPWLLAPVTAVALLFLGYISYDFASHWRRRLDGFAEVLAAIPPGQSVQALTEMPDPHYTRGHPYLIQHYVARKGGRAVPHLKGHPGSYWITMKEPPPSPQWGDPLQFVWQEHARGYDWFVMELPWKRSPAEPMYAAPPGAVEQVMARGRFVLWRRK